jgi:hypothetical protein
MDLRLWLPCATTKRWSISEAKKRLHQVAFGGLETVNNLFRLNLEYAD